MKVLCEHTMTNTTYICADGRFPVIKGVAVWLDKDMADRYPATFKQIGDDSVKLDPGVKAINDDIVATVIAEAEKDQDMEYFKKNLKESLKGTEVETLEGSTVAEEDAELVGDVEMEMVELVEDPESKADVQADLIKLIDAFTVKKKLDVFAEERGVILDGRKTLKSMKKNLKETWKLN